MSPSPPSPATSPPPPAATRTSRCSTSCGRSRQSAQGVYGTSWCRRPTRQIACRLTTTYAGYEGESLLLQDLYRRGLQQPQIGDDLHAGDGILMFWSHSPVAPWQDERWLAEMRRTLRPNAYQRLVLNEFASAEIAVRRHERHGTSCVQPSLVPTLERMPIYVGVDASVQA